MQINSVNAYLTNDAMERTQMWDAGSGPDLQLITAGTSLIVLARGDAAVKVFSALHPLFAICHQSRKPSQSSVLPGRRSR